MKSLTFGSVDDVGLGAAERADLLVLDRLAVELVEAVADRVVEHLFAPDALVDQLRRHLALAESGDVHGLGDVAVRVVDAGLQLVRRDCDGQLRAGGAQLLDRGLHDVVLLFTLVLYVVVRVGATGFEPAASRSQTERSTKLSYAPGYPCPEPAKGNARLPRKLTSASL